ncbi:MAG: Dak phosphatase, partial [Nocardioides sp.]
FEDSGAVVVPGGPGQRPSAGQLLEAIRATDAAEVIVLPNDADSIRVAEVAARTAEEETGAEVVVIPTRTQVQGIAALAVHEPGRAFAGDITEMTATSRHVRHGAVTVAAKEAMTMAGACQPGDVLGVIGGDFALIGSSPAEVGAAVLDRLLAGGGELVTLVAGADAADLADVCRAHLEQSHPSVDVVCYDGGQPRYLLLLSVE